MSGNREGVEMLLEAGADPNALDNNGEKPSDFAGKMMRDISGTEATQQLLKSKERPKSFIERLTSCGKHQKSHTR